MTDHRTAPYGAALLRLSLGAMFMAHGLLKWLVFTLPGAAEFFVSVGLPGWMVYPVTALEILGGAALALGIFTRPIAAVFALQLLGVITVHLPNGWLFSNANGGWEYPVFLFAATVALVLLGDGAFALRPSRAAADTGSH